MKRGITTIAAVAIAATAQATEKCTGDADIDAVLDDSNIADELGLTNGAVYTWKGFCKAIRQYNGISGIQQFYLGEGKCKKGLSNIAALLAQAQWESANFTACDETNWSGKELGLAACTQKESGELYHELVGGTDACEVDKDMEMTGVTSDLQCTPGTLTEKCCWWGRGAIQTTGPSNYGLLQKTVFAKITDLKSIDLCKNPSAICDTSDGLVQKNWISAVEFWAHSVQGAHPFYKSLDAYVDGDFSLEDSKVDENGKATTVHFASGTGGVVNAGGWYKEAHKDASRVDRFKTIIKTLKSSDKMTSCD